MKYSYARAILTITLVILSACQPSDFVEVAKEVTKETERQPASEAKESSDPLTDREKCLLYENCPAHLKDAWEAFLADQSDIPSGIHIFNPYSELLASGAGFKLHAAWLTAYVSEPYLIEGSHLHAQPFAAITIQTEEGLQSFNIMFPMSWDPAEQGFGSAPWHRAHGIYNHTEVRFRWQDEVTACIDVARSQRQEIRTTCRVVPIS